MGVVFILRVPTSNNGYTAFGYAAMLCNATILTSLRVTIRNNYGIRGNVIGDFFAATFAFPQVLFQVLETLTELKEYTPDSKKSDEEDVVDCVEKPVDQ